MQLARTETLKAEFSELWSRATYHPFIEELGSGALPIDKFRRYFLQDYLFVNDLARMSGIAIARAPDLPAARPIHEFLSNLMGAEDALFLRAFSSLNIPESDFRSVKPHPTTAAFGDFLRGVRIAFVRHRLIHSDEPVAAIARAAGFADQAHCNRTFKRLMGLSPARWRRLQRD